MPSRISGKLGRLSLDGGLNWLDGEFLFDWTLEFQVEAAECGAKGDQAEQYTLGAFTGRVTASRYSSDDPDNAGSGQGDSLLARRAVNAALSAGNSTGGTAIEFALQQIAGAAIGTQIIGSGYVTRGGLTAPRQMAQDTFEITLNRIPAITNNTL